MSYPAIVLAHLHNLHNFSQLQSMAVKSLFFLVRCGERTIGQSFSDIVIAPFIPCVNISMKRHASSVI